MRIFLVPVALCLLLSGCFANPFGKPDAPETPIPETPLSPVPQFISMNNAGAQASIDDPAFVHLGLRSRLPPRRGQPASARSGNRRPLPSGRRMGAHAPRLGQRP